MTPYHDRLIGQGRAIGDRAVRTLVVAAGMAVLSTVAVASCGTSAETARNPEPTRSAPRRVRHVPLGHAVTLADGRLRMAVAVTKVLSSAKGRGTYEQPRKGERFAAVRFVLKNVGETDYQDSPTFGAKLVDTTGQGYDPTVAAVTAGPGFARVVRLPHGRARSGFVVFAIPRRARIARVEYALNAGDAPERAEWRVR
jgi:hypothetical protein